VNGQRVDINQAKNPSPTVGFTREPREGKKEDVKEINPLIDRSVEFW
jgi:hypothetical protein